jgi:rifampicin phosphotransferase
MADTAKDRADRWITDTEASTRFPVYTRANASDVLPNPVSPLGATITWITGVLEGWRDGNIRQGAFSRDELDSGVNPCCAMFNGYLYVNASVVRVYGERAGAGAAAIDAAFFGNRPDTPPYVPHPEDQSAEAAERIGATMGWVMSADEWPEMMESKALADAARTERGDLSSLSDVDLVARARELTGLQRRLFSDHVLSSSNTAVGPTILGQVAPAHMLRLIASAGDVDSAAPSFAMWRLSREVRESPVLMAAFDAGIADLLDRLRSTDDTAAARFLAHLDEFMLEYGARGPNEWDPYSEVWETRPELVLALVDRMRVTDEDQSPVVRNEAVAADRTAATEEVLASLGDDEETKGLMLAAQASALRFLAWRERTKTNCVKAIHEQRMALRELGRRQVEGGALDDQRLVFMLLDAELDEFLADPSSFTDRLVERQSAWEVLWALEPPYFVEADKGVPPLSSLTRKGAAEVMVAVPGEVLAGSPGCAGVARGPARVLLDPGDPLALEPGDILVAPNTDPSWTPLFVPAAGVIVDVGAMNSHAVIVSRELGIPCAVSVVDATKRIPDGALVEVDGGTGTVTML